MTTKKPVVAAAPKKAVVKKTSPAAATLKPTAISAPKAEAKKPRQKIKVVRDSFTMPQHEYQKIAEIKEICSKSGLQVKKSEVLRAGLLALTGLSATQLKKMLGGLEKIKTGRPKKH
ncbi:MAG: hypothetical protein U1D70_05925 [Methylobacter sp.]|nr:hypothetical protein [Methylobacter sp.]